MKYGWYMIQSGNFAERFPDSHLCGNLRGPKRRLRSIETAYPPQFEMWMDSVRIFSVNSSGRKPYYQLECRES